MKIEVILWNFGKKNTFSTVYSAMTKYSNEAKTQLRFKILKKFQF